MSKKAYKIIGIFAFCMALMSEMNHDSTWVMHMMLMAIYMELLWMNTEPRR